MRELLPQFLITFGIVSWTFVTWLLLPLAQFEVFAGGLVVGMVGMGIFMLPTGKKENPK